MVAFAAALLAVSGIMGAGYFAGRVKLIGSEGLSALGVFLGRFSLPALLFTELSSLSLGDIKISVLSSVLVGKIAMFIGVLSFSLTFDFRGKGTQLKKLIGVSALRAVFCTQSNDFALGLPIVTALFKSSHPHLIAMLYLLSPISLLLLNPIAFLLMSYAQQTDSEDEEADTTIVSFSSDHGETTDQKNAARRSESKKRPPLRSVIGRVAKTPIVACSLAGIVWNLLLGRNSVPGPIKFALETLGDGFTPVALFFTGLSLVGKVAKLTPDRLLLPTSLAVSKSLILATVLYLGVGIAGGDASERGFAFIYGAIPTAPSVLVYAHEYFGLSEPKVLDQTAVALVLGTLMATPILFVAGVLIKDSNDTVATKARIAALYLCVPSAVLSSWLIATFSASWRAERQRLNDFFTWRLADSRVLLLLILAAGHAVGSANGATCYASTSRQGHHSIALLRFAISNFCRLAPCGATAAAALLLTTSPTSITSSSSQETRIGDTGHQQNTNRLFFCMKTFSRRLSCLASPRDHSSAYDSAASRREPLLPPPAIIRTNSRRRAPSLSEVFIDPATAEEEERDNSSIEENTTTNPMQLPTVDTAKPRHQQTTAPEYENYTCRKLAWALSWCLLVPIVVTIFLPSVFRPRSNVRREDACGYVYGTAQSLLTAMYCVLCLIFSLIGLKRARHLVDTRYEILRSASAGSLHRLATFSPPGSPGGSLRAASADALPGGADTVGSGDALALLAAQVARENRRARRRGETWTPPTDAQLANARDTTRLAAGLGHRMLVLIIIHLIFAFVVCCACIAHLAPASAKTTTGRVLSFAEDTMAASLGIACFFVFGLARNQVLWQYISSKRQAWCGDYWSIRVGSLRLGGPASPRLFGQRNCQNSSNSIDSMLGGPPANHSIDNRRIDPFADDQCFTAPGRSVSGTLNGAEPREDRYFSQHRRPGAIAGQAPHHLDHSRTASSNARLQADAYRLLSVDVNEI